ncbi:MAG: tryptophan-rich sensory protein, partial [Alphaproteobacteria bacterium]|nr:tryptophan-rich sensory protein [Alphaproteobacteria bacterium]
IQLVLNWLWTPIFFGWHLTGIALVDILMIAAITVYITIKSWSKHSIIAYVMIVYLLWLLFASYLNFVIWISS